MKVALAQTRPIRGDFEANLVTHVRMIERAARQNADLIIFPELSLTGYEPSLAATLAVELDDARFDPLQTLSDAHQITIGVGYPLKTESRITIGMPLFRPGQARSVYHKHYLHADEEPFFVPGENLPILPFDRIKVAPAICYELSIPAHAALAAELGAGIYVASVAKHAQGMAEAGKRLAEIARIYQIPALIVNCVGPSEDDGWIASGGSAAWDRNGEMIGRLNNTDEGLLIYDSNTQQISAVQP